MTLPPPFDPELAAVLEILPTEVRSTITPEMVAGRRQRYDAALSDEQLSRDGFFEVVDKLAPGHEGTPDVSLLVCRPSKSDTMPPGPVLYYIHGGGMIGGNNRTGIEEILDWAVELNAVVVSAEYRLAPEHRYPAQIEDAYSGLQWTASHAGMIGADPSRIVLAGKSAGGGLAAALALLARDRKGPLPIGQILICPMLDDRNDTPSAFQMAGLGVWDRTSNQTGWSAMLGEHRAVADVPAYAAPARAQDLSGLPPAFLDVGSAETFRDEVVAYAARIWQAGGAAELHVWPGGFHGFTTFAPRAALSQAARAARLDWIRRMLANERKDHRRINEYSGKPTTAQ
jgi:acetyl esterase/lipase